MSTSYRTALIEKYNALNAAAFPGGVRTPGPFLKEPPRVGTNAERLRPPYLLLFDEGNMPKWVFGGTADAPGQNALHDGGFRLEAYALDLGDCDRIIAAILWNGQTPNNRAGVAFMTMTLTTPQKGMAGAVIPTRNQGDYAGYQFEEKRVHVVTQSFTIKFATSGDGT